MKSRGPLKIGFNGRVLAIPQMRGWTRYTVELLRALSALEQIQLVLFTLEELHPAHLRGINAKVVQFGAARETLWSEWALPRMIAREGVALFHAPADRGLPSRSPCPMVVTVHNSYERAHWRSLFPSWKQKLWYWKNELVNYCSADVVLTVTDAVRAEIIKARIAPAAKTHRIYPAPSAAFSDRPEATDGAVLERYGLSSPYVLYVGGYDRHKNVNGLVEAFDRAGLRDHRLAIVAEPQWEYPALLSNWKGLGCFPRLRLIQAASEEVPAFYRHAEFFVNPSLWESFSFPLVEAMASGVPILCSDRPALREVAGGAAVFFQAGDADGLSHLMERMARDATLRATLRAKGLERSKAFSWRTTAQETLSVYQALLSRRQGSPADSGWPGGRGCRL